MNTLSKKFRLMPMALLLLMLGTNCSVTAQIPAPPTDTVAPATNGELPAPPPPRPAPPVPGRPDRPAGPLPAGRPDPGPRAPEAGREVLQPVAVFKGSVSRFLVNEDLVYDGFTLKNESDSFVVRFAPTMGQTVLKILKTGSSVIVNGVPRQVPTGKKEIEAVSFSAGGSTTDIQLVPSPPAPETPTFVNGSGKIIGLGADREGRINTLFLTNHDALRLPPAGLAGMNPAPIVGSTVSFTGTLRPTATGEATQSDTKIIRCQTITVNGHQYLVGRR